MNRSGRTSTKPRYQKAPSRNSSFTDLVDRAFDGSAVGLVMQALSAKRASPEEIKEIRRLLSTFKQD